MLTAHVGNWEWLGIGLTKTHRRFACVARRTSHPWGTRFLTKRRSAAGIPLLWDDQAPRQGMRLLQENGMLVFLADQSPPGAWRPGTFLGLPTRVSPLLEFWGRAPDVAAKTANLIREPGGYRLHVGILDGEVNLAEAYDRWLSPLVRNHPTQYAGWWHHRLVPRGTSLKSPPR